MAATTSSTLSADLQTYFNKTLLRQANYESVLDQFGEKVKIPSNSSKTISFTQYADLTPVNTTLTEGTPPTDTALSSSAITATIDQLGAFVTLTDLAILTPKHPVVDKTLQLLGTQAARTYDRQINGTVVAGTSVFYADSVANRAALGTTNKLDWSDVRRAVATLRKNGASPMADGYYVLVVDPSVEQDLMDDTTFANAVYRQASPIKGNELYKGEIVTFAGVRVVRSNDSLPTIASTVTVHVSLLFGRDAFAITDLQNLDTYKEGPGSISDPLHQKMTVGWKVGFKSVILNNNFMARLESYSAY